VALGIDLADPLCRAGDQKRVDNWNAFFVRWPQKPEFVGKYFGETDHPFETATIGPWLNGEIRFDLRTVVTGFSNLLYVLPFSPTGPYNEKARVSIEGKPLTDADGVSLLDAAGKKLYENGKEVATGRRAYCPFYSQEGLKEDLTPRSNATIRSIAQGKARSTCAALELLITRDPFRRQEIEISTSGKVFVFLDVEPWTKLHKMFWKGWAEQVSLYTVNLGTISNPRLVQPFLPCLYCALNKTAPFLPAVADIFKEKNAASCAALATPWNPDGAVYDTEAKALGASQDAIWTDWPFKDPIQLQPAPASAVPVVLWQHKINLSMASIPPSMVDLASTWKEQYQNRGITDYLLKIVW
jgi:hypothetical protein